MSFRASAQREPRGVHDLPAHEQGGLEAVLHLGGGELSDELHGGREGVPASVAVDEADGLLGRDRGPLSEGEVDGGGARVEPGAAELAQGDLDGDDVSEGVDLGGR